MTAAAAKKLASEREEPAQQSAGHVDGLWIDKSLLPTNLANKRNLPKEKANESAGGAQNRILWLADVALGTSRGTRVRGRRKKQRKIQGWSEG